MVHFKILSSEVGALSPIQHGVTRTEINELKCLAVRQASRPI